MKEKKLGMGRNERKGERKKEREGNEIVYVCVCV